MSVGLRIQIEQILTRAAEYKASDIHLTVGAQPTVRVDGKLVALEDKSVLTPEFMESVVDDLLTEEQKTILEKERRIVFTYDLATKARFKVNVFYQRGYPSASLRLITSKIKTIAELGLPKVVEELTKLKRGLVIVSGQFGSGRSATMAAIINAINHDRAEHIVTIENPIEYIFTNARSIVEQREIGQDTHSFLRGIDNIFQEDANVVMISEMGSSDVIVQALRVAESGRLIFSSMSTDSAVRTVEKLITSFATDEQEQIRIQLSETLQGIVAQRLLPRIGGGSVVVPEVLKVTSAIRSVIRDGAVQQISTIMQTSREEGMIPLDRALAQRVKNGEILEDEALANANDRNSLKLLLRPIPGA